MGERSGRMPGSKAPKHDISHAEANEIASAQFAIDCEIEHRQIADPALMLEPGAGGPNVSRLQRRPGSNNATGVPNLPLPLALSFDMHGNSPWGAASATILPMMWLRCFEPFRYARLAAYEKRQVETQPQSGRSAGRASLLMPERGSRGCSGCSDVKGAQLQKSVGRARAGSGLPTDRNRGTTMSERSQLWRAPLQGGGRWQYEGNVEIAHGAWVGKSPDGQRRSGVTVRGVMASGGGNSKVVMQIGTDDFLNLFRAMCAEDREATIIAFSQAIKECISPGEAEA